MTHTAFHPELLKAISKQAFADEHQVVETLLKAAEPYDTHWPVIRKRAHELILALREAGMGLGVEPFLQEYGLSTQEGISLMCMAEALLRIPDSATADRLIASSFQDADWQAHLGHSASLAVNASSWGMLLTGKVLQLDQNGQRNMFGRMVKRAGEPVIREALKAAMRLMASQFVLGETIDDALSRGQGYEKKGYRLSYDMLGEGARSKEQAEHYYQSYMHAITVLGKRDTVRTGIYDAPSISIKLTALHPRYEWRQRERVYAELLPRLKELVLAARQAEICVAIDAEEATRLDLELELFGALFSDPDFDGYQGLGFVLQAYQKRALPALDYLIALSRASGKRMPIRLVKGAYWDTEVKVAQLAGLPSYPVFTVKTHSDVSYLACAHHILEHPDCFFPQFATHNAVTIAAIESVAGDREYEFQRLFGMGETLYKPLTKHRRCRIYAPVGEHKDLLAYLIRRLLENGANSSFINMLWNEELPLDGVLANPMDQARCQWISPLPLPEALYPDRKNSPGYDLGNRDQMQTLQQKMADHGSYIAPCPDTSHDELHAMLDRAHSAFPDWEALPANNRAIMLERAADLMEERMDEAMNIIIREGHRTIPDAVSEVREAIDFCRYYAARARELFTEQLLDGPTGERNSLQLHGRGTFACISPWNFPLAIFIGQIAAALAAGNCVIAKPAEQTPATGAWGVKLLHEAGVPEAVVQLACGTGEVIGAALTADLRIDGVAFTGSVAAARHIQRSLAERDGPIIPLIAETGGLNCMIVDSSTLPEQAVDDIVLSAFGSAGQRCSALRVLYVHEDMADTLITLLRGAMAELKLGDPIDPATDIGPVIDAEAQANLLKHIERMKQEATLLAASALPQNIPDTMAFVAPHAFELQSIDQIGGEIFGPVLHVIRYKGEELNAVIDAINGTGFGLTFGVHSRIPAFYEEVLEKIKAGNRYVNRGMTGAVVGVQPFGGEGLSGTGPKAGSPHTLLRFAGERATSVNTAAIGGNIDLLIQ